MTYTASECTAIIGDKTFIVRNLFPQFDHEDDKDKVRIAIEENLYSVFNKYIRT